MDTHEARTREPSPWRREGDPQAVAALGKLGEELSELSVEVAAGIAALQKRIARVMIQGLAGLDPDTGRDNRSELAKEITDVEALVAVARHYVPGIGRDAERFAAKVAHKTKWIDGILAEAAPTAPLLAAAGA